MPSRRDFLRFSGLVALALAASRRRGRAQPRAQTTEGSAPQRVDQPAADRAGKITLFLCGDVMTGRGIDQILSVPSDPRLHERWVESAVDYVKLAERASGSIPRSVEPTYIWGEALAEVERCRPDLRIINLETSVTTSSDWQLKGINYRMHPDNVACLTAAGIDCCVLANNHVLDWGRAGLLQTLATLRGAGLATAGAGENVAEAMAPARLEIASGQRVLLWAWGAATSGIPRSWKASESKPGVALLPDLSIETARSIGAAIREVRRPGDLVVVSIHWGGNWGYAVPAAHRQFARALIDEGDVDLIHGHSSHHPKGIEIYRERPILYGCGDFINDYEGISGYEELRSELVLGYLATLDPASHRLAALELLPFRMRRFRLERAAPEEVHWLRDTLDRESSALGAGVVADPDGRLMLRW